MIRSGRFRSDLWIGGNPIAMTRMSGLDLSCSPELLMSDINAPIEGDIAKSFRPYDHDINLVHFPTLVARYKIEASKEDAEGLIHHLEGFKCRD